MTRNSFYPIRDEVEYEAAVDEIERCFDNEPLVGTPEAERFERLARLIEDYERRYWANDR